MSADFSVDVYHLHADIYEWGWGTSFHFSPLLPGKSIPASDAAHEARIAALLGLKVGCRAHSQACSLHDMASVSLESEWK